MLPAVIESACGTAVPLPGTGAPELARVWNRATSVDVIVLVNVVTVDGAVRADLFGQAQELQLVMAGV
jgi:hypothetical protein